MCWKTSCTESSWVTLKLVIALLTAFDARAVKAKSCLDCHSGYDRIFTSTIGTRKAEMEFVARSVAKRDSKFFENKCGSCHLQGCADCHGTGEHPKGKPPGSACLKCHKGYFTGADYFGRAPREDHLRYQREKPDLKMKPDLHQEAGLGCGDCHSMKSLAAGMKFSKTCIDCHRPDPAVLEHRIPGHLSKMECYACHSAWGAQEYGTYYLRFEDSPVSDEFELQENDGKYAKSSGLKKQDAAPLGLNSRGKVSPIRPQFELYFTRITKNRVQGVENELLAAEWRAWFPHTIRRGTVSCENCHENPARFLLDEPREGGRKLKAAGARLVNGSFITEEQFKILGAKTPAYKRGVVEKWRKLIRSVDTSSR